MWKRTWLERSPLLLRTRKVLGFWVIDKWVPWQRKDREKGGGDRKASSAVHGRQFWKLTGERKEDLCVCVWVVFFLGFLR